MCLQRTRNYESDDDKEYGVDSHTRCRDCRCEGSLISAGSAGDVRNRGAMMTNQYGAIVLSGLLLFAVACGKKEMQPERASLQAPSRTAVVEREKRTLEIAGTVRATDVAQLASRFAAFVTRVQVQAGTRVSQGDLLVLLDDRNVQAQRSKITAAREEAQLSAQAAEAQMRLATTTFNRIRELYERQSASQQEFDEAKTKKEASEAAYQAALQRIVQAESDMREVQANSEYLRIGAPFNGIVTSVSVDAGTFINPGQTIVSVENPSSYEVTFAIEENLLNALSRGSEVMVSIPALSLDKHPARIKEINAALDAGTRTFQVKATLEPNPELRSGLSARVSLSSEANQSLWIPAEFVSRNDDIETVLVKKAGEWRRVLVKSGTSKNRKVEILAGLNQGEEVGL